MDNRTAISGLIPDRPFRMLDRVLRLTPSAWAASVTLRPKGPRQSTRRISPGWGGLCIFMVESVVVFIINILNVEARKLECHTPAPAYPDSPNALPVTFQGMQVQSWQRHVSCFDRHMKPAQNEPQPAGVLGLDTGRRSAQEKAFQTLMSEFEYGHMEIVTRNVPGYNPGLHLVWSKYSAEPQPIETPWLTEGAGKTQCDA